MHVLRILGHRFCAAAEVTPCVHRDNVSYEVSTWSRISAASMLECCLDMRRVHAVRGFLLRSFSLMHLPFINLPRLAHSPSGTILKAASSRLDYFCASLPSPPSNLPVAPLPLCLALRHGSSSLLRPSFTHLRCVLTEQRFCCSRSDNGLRVGRTRASGQAASYHNAHDCTNQRVQAFHILCKHGVLSAKYHSNMDLWW